MVAVAIEVEGCEVPSDPALLRAIARSYGPLRTVTAEQAPIIRAVTEFDRGLRPKWQRFGQGHHGSVDPGAYAQGVMWVRGPSEWVQGPKGWGWRPTRHRVVTGRPHQVWRTREHWLTVVVPAVLDAAGPEALKGCTKTAKATPYGVSRRTFIAWCTEISKYAHQGTGRRLIIRPDKLANLLGRHQKTVERCQEFAEALGLYVTVEPGRMLEEKDSYAVRQRGSCQRGWSNDAALVVPQDLASEGVWAAPTEWVNRENVAPTSGRYRKTRNLRLVDSLDTQERSARRKEPPPAALAPTNKRRIRQLRSVTPDPGAPVSLSRFGSGRVYDPKALELARDLAEELSWLRGIAPGRLEPVLRRFVNCRLAWTAGDVNEAINQANRRLGRASMTHTLVKHPPGLLAKYLRDFDPDNDHPRFWYDPAAQREPALSPTQLANKLLLRAHRGGGAGQTPAIRAAALAKIRHDLRAHHVPSVDNSASQPGLSDHSGPCIGCGSPGTLRPELPLQLPVCHSCYAQANDN